MIGLPAEGKIKPIVSAGILKEDINNFIALLGESLVKNKKVGPFIVALMASMSLGGCADSLSPMPVKAYYGSVHPLSEVASVAAGPIGGTEITLADNTETGLCGPLCFAVRKSIGIHLLPGEHTLTFVHRWDFQEDGPLMRYKEAKKDIKVSVEAGHSYIPKATVSGSLVYFSLEDKGTGYNQTCLISEIKEELPPGC